MSDIFREVEEEVRRERLEKIWKQYGDYIVAAAALLILAGAAFRLWTYYEARERARASDSYLAAEQLLASGQSRAAAQSFGRLAKDAPAGYDKLSELQAANALTIDNKGEALAIYRKLAGDSDQVISAIARLRAAWLLVDSAPKSDVDAMLAPIAGNETPWHQVAQEILAYADFHTGAVKQAQGEFQRLANDPKAPSGVRGRSRAMATFIAAGGDRDVGKVPFPVPPKLPAPLKATVAPGQQASSTASAGAPPGGAPPAAGAPQSPSNTQAAQTKALAPKPGTTSQGPNPK
ncbi:MAG TPA: tetratricopeptide repeat protein [Rhizomicrobium sp.]